MGTLTKTLYETDFVEWADHTAELLRQGKLDEVDMEHLIEEVEGLAGSDRSAVSSQLYRLLKHPVKQQIQPERKGRSWTQSITNAQSRVASKVVRSPSLRRFGEEEIERAYTRAVRDALVETGLKARKDTLGIPAQCPWSFDELLEGDADNLNWE